MGDCLSATLVSLMALWLALVDQNPFHCYLGLSAISFRGSRVCQAFKTIGEVAQGEEPLAYGQHDVIVYVKDNCCLN